LYFAIDAQAGDTLQVRFGETAPPDERSFNDQALTYMSAAHSVDAVSDGVKAYTGILVQLYAGDPKIITIDEPEAFLHPALIQRLAKEIAKIATAEGKHVFVATHSPQFVWVQFCQGLRLTLSALPMKAALARRAYYPVWTLQN
jgi:ABC-type cobalamin/Fe3+-siderophores transport system ATPase subunit